MLIDSGRSGPGPREPAVVAKPTGSRIEYSHIQLSACNGETNCGYMSCLTHSEFRSSLGIREGTLPGSNPGVRANLTGDQIVTKVNKRSLMAVGSKWIVAEDFEAENFSAAKWHLEDDPSDPHGRRKAVQSHKHMTKFTKGEIIEITDKSSTVMFYTAHCIDGVFYPLKIEGRGEGYFRLGDFSPHVEIHEEVLQLLWVLFSPSLGYITGYDWPEHQWNDDHTVFAEVKPATIRWDAKLSKAMKKKRPQDAKQFLLCHSGYYDNVDNASFSQWDMDLGGQKLEFPTDLVIQEINKTTKEIRATSLASEYLEGMFRLRPLLIRYGSAARDLFKKIEKDGSEFETLLMFKDTDTDSFDDKSPLITELKESFKQSKFKRDQYVMTSNGDSVAFAFKTRADAMLFRLSVGSTLSSQQLDAKTLKEEIQ